MIDSARLERALIAVARRYAPALVPPGWSNAGDYRYSLPDLARRLAAEGALVLSAEARPDAINAALVYKDWADSYTSLYNRLCAGLFPSFMNVSAFYVDQAQPPVAVIQGECAPVIAAIGGFITPYVSTRAGTRASEIEVRGILDIMLDALEAGDLLREEYIRLRDDVTVIARKLLDLPLQHTVIVPPANAIFGELESSAAVQNVVNTPPPTLPEGVPDMPPPPPTLPETPPAKPAPVDVPFPADAVPIFFNPARRDPNQLPPPPVPPLPGDIPR